MSSRFAHRLTLFSDRDVWHSALVAGSACVFSAGLVYLAYFVHVLRVAWRAPSEPAQGDCVLLFGKHAPGGRIDADFEARLARAAALWQRQPPRCLVLLGGGHEGMASEAEIARDSLLARASTMDSALSAPSLHLESSSRDTLQNLRNARDLLCTDVDARGDRSDARGRGDAGRVTLLSNRYHLARCAKLADQLGLNWELCAAETHLQLSPHVLWRIATEAGYVCWTDIGTRWARWIGSQRMLARVT